MVEDYGWNVVVIQMFIWFVIKQVFREMVICCNCYWCQFYCICVIVYCVNIFNIGVLIFIDDDIVFFVSFNVSGFQVDVVIGRFVINCLNQVIYCFIVIIFQFQCQVIIGIFYYCFWDGVGVQLWVFGVYYFDQCFGNYWVEVVQWCMFMYKQMCFCVEVVNYVCQFNGDVICVNNCYVFW